MLSYNTPITVEKHPHRFLGTPNCLVFIKHFYTLFLSLNLEDQELSCTISYFSSFCHIHSFRLQRYYYFLKLKVSYVKSF